MNFFYENIHFNFNPGRKYDIVLAWLLSEEFIIQCNLELKKTKYQKSKLIDLTCHLSSLYPTIERRH